MGKVELPAVLDGIGSQWAVFVAGKHEFQAAKAEFDAGYEAEEGGDDGENDAVAQAGAVPKAVEEGDG